MTMRTLQRKIKQRSISIDFYIVFFVTDGTWYPGGAVPFSYISDLKRIMSKHIIRDFICASDKVILCFIAISTPPNI